MEYAKFMDYGVVVEAPIAFNGGNKSGPNNVSLPAPTASTVRGVVRRILGKWECRYTVLSTAILHLGGEYPCTTNELKSFPKDQFDPKDQHTTRTNVNLVDVKYLFRVRLEVKPRDASDTLAKYHAMFTRRIRRGQVWGHHPSLGPAQNFCSVRFPEKGEVLTPIPLNQNLGIQPFDQDFSDPQHPWYYYPMVVANGVVDYPSWEEVKRFGLSRKGFNQ